MRARARARAVPTSYLLSRQGGEAIERSAKAIQTGGEEFKELKVAEDLELLADFVGDVGVFRVELGWLVFAGVEIGTIV